MWHYQVQDVPDAAGRPSGTYRLAVTSDDGHGGPYSDPSHSHPTAEGVDGCQACTDYCDGIVSAAAAEAAPAPTPAPGPAAAETPAETGDTTTAGDKPAPTRPKK